VRRGTGLIALGSTLAYYNHLSTYAYVVFGDDFALARRLSAKTLHYESISICTSWNCGVSYAQAVANGWLLKDAGGAYVRPYGDEYLPDVGNSDFQQAFVARALSVLRRHPGVDGIEIDNIQTDIASITGGVYPAAYPSEQSFADAEIRFVAVVGRALKRAGFYVLVNAGGFTHDRGFDEGRVTNAFWRRLAPYVGGLMNEYWMQDANHLTRLMDDSGGGYMRYWSGWQRLVRTAQSGGADFVGVSIGTRSHLRTMRFGKASFLLDWNGCGGAFVYTVTPAYTSRVSPWNEAWTADLGTPRGPKRLIATKVWRRDFSKGTVVVNPTKRPVTTTVGGRRHRIGPSDALILTR